MFDVFWYFLASLSVCQTKHRCHVHLQISSLSFQFYFFLGGGHLGSFVEVMERKFSIPHKVIIVYGGWGHRVSLKSLFKIIINYNNIFSILYYLHLKINENFHFLFSFFLNLFIIYLLFIFGCVGSSFLCEGFFQLRQAGATLHRDARASHYCGQIGRASCRERV